MGRILCFFGFHKREITEKRRGIAGGQHCLRDGCGWKINSIKWPCPKSE